MSATTVTFYSVPISSNLDLAPLICSLTADSVSTNKHVHVLTESTELSQLVDESMWTFPEHRFLPHVISNEPTSSAQITIGARHELGANFHVLINVSPKILDESYSGTTVYEFVTLDVAQKTIARTKFKAYKNHGWDVHYVEKDDWML